MAWSIKISDGRAPLRTVGIQVGLRLLADNRRRVPGAAAERRRLRQVNGGRVPIVPTRTTRGEVTATVAVAPSARGGRGSSVVAVLATFGDLPFSGVRKVAGRASLSARRRWWSRMR